MGDPTTQQPPNAPPSKIPPWLAWVETAAVTAALLLLGLWLRPADPFFVEAVFPWLALAPLLAGIRYGFANGMGSALLLAVGLVTAWRWQLLPMERFPAEYSLGLLAVGMLAGEFSDLWQRRIQRLTAFSEYRRTRLEEFARGYHLLKVSHDALEQKVAGTTQNLREALMTLRRELVAAPAGQEPPGDGDLGRLGRRVLDIFAGYGWVQIAALYGVDPRGQLSPTPLETLGRFDPLDPADPLLAEALDRREVITVRQGAAAASELLVAIPLCDVYGRTWGVVAVRELLFVALQQENLQLLAVLGGHVGDILSFGARAYRGDPSDQGQFQEHLRRSVADLRGFALPAVAVALSFRGDPADTASLPDELLGQRRGLDHATLLADSQGRPVIFFLLNLTDEAGMEGYMERLSSLVRRRTGHALEQLGVRIQGQPLSPRESADQVYQQLCGWCDVDPG